METAFRKNVRSTHEFSAKAFLWLYKGILSPALHVLGGPNSGCRYPQSCSEFAYESIREQGILLGGFRSLKRILSCNPWMAPRPQFMFALRSSTVEEWNS